MIHKQTLFICLLSFGFVWGCGPKLPDGMPKLYPVTLKVTQEGTPLEGATVVLAGGADVWTATGITDAQGLTILHTEGRYPGVPEGTFKVSVTKTISEGERPPSRPMPGDEEALKRYREYQQSGKSFRQFHTTPLEYRSTETSPISAEIKKGVKNVAVNVESTVKEEIISRGGVMGL